MQLHPQIAGIAKDKIPKQEYDSAIYDAAGLLEKKLQELGNTTSINATLAAEVFDTGKLKLSQNAQLDAGAKELFCGFFRLIRNDRAHWKEESKPLEIP